MVLLVIFNGDLGPTGIREWQIKWFCCCHRCRVTRLFILTVLNCAPDGVHHILDKVLLEISHHFFVVCKHSFRSLVRAAVLSRNLRDFVHQNGDFVSICDQFTCILRLARVTSQLGAYKIKFWRWCSWQSFYLFVNFDLQQLIF